MSGGKCQEIWCCFSAAETFIALCASLKSTKLRQLVNILSYVCLLCLENPAYTHMHDLISYCYHPCPDGDTEAQRDSLLPMLLAKLRLALLLSGQGPEYLPHCSLFFQKFQAGSPMPPHLGSPMPFLDPVTLHRPSSFPDLLSAFGDTTWIA